MKAWDSGGEKATGHKEMTMGEEGIGGRGAIAPGAIREDSPSWRVSRILQRGAGPVPGMPEASVIRRGSALPGEEEIVLGPEL